MITACIITRNQQDKLKKCLQHLKKYNIEIVVVDTGSVDDTKNIAKEYTEYVFDFPWENDFAKARNFAIEKAPSNLILSIDSDEYVTALNVAEIEQLMSKNVNDVGQITLTNIFNADEIRMNDELLGRIFDRRYCHYVGRIHEQIECKNGQEHSFFFTSTHILHDGYLLDDEERAKKTERNIRILKDELEMFLSEYEGKDLTKMPLSVQNRAGYILYQLGKSYYMKHDYKTAAEYFDLGLSFDLNDKLGYVIDMVETYGYALINSGQVKKALALINLIDTFGNSADFRFLLGVIYMNNEKYDEAVEQFVMATTFSKSKVRGVNSYLAYYNIGVIYECLGDRIRAIKYYKKCNNYKPANNRLRILLETE